MASKAPNEGEARNATNQEGNKAPTPPAPSHRSMQDLLQMVSPTAELDPAVEHMLKEIAREFVDNVVTYSCKLAKHRDEDTKTVELKDVLLHLEKNWNIQLPGHSADVSKSFSTGGSDAHTSRLKLVKEAKAQDTPAFKKRKRNSRDSTDEAGQF
eukprot:g70857.t1